MNRASIEKHYFIHVKVPVKADIFRNYQKSTVFQIAVKTNFL